ncbi:hypothetical protein [Mannheimia indoligenes]|uniref:hypothetical protein n=1 Tax=Mannheimia indoligenes TaxID=3103145 RepID=UPI002FE688A9
MKYAEFDLYTDKNGVLRNKLGAKSDEELDTLESRLVAMNTLSLRLFREGNGRSQREFIIQLALKFNYRLHFQNVTPQEMIDTSERSALYVDNILFEQIIFDRLEFINKETL